MKRGEKKNSDSIGLYITETMPRCIRNFSMELGTQSGPIVSSIEGTPNRHIIQEALSIVTHGFDQQENIAVCNYYKVADGLKLTKGSRNVEPVQNMFNGYIINSTEALYQNDMDYAVTMNRAKIFCLSLEGIFQPSWGFNEAVDICMKAHAVRYRSASTTSRHPVLVEYAQHQGVYQYEYTCDCQAWWHSLICAHVVAAMHLNKDIDLHSMTAVIDRPCKVGRPKHYVPVGFAAHLPVEKVLNTYAAGKWLGTELSTKVSDGRVYRGTVTSVYEGLNHENEPEVIFKVQYDHQYKEDMETLFPKHEDFTLDQLMQGIAHYKEYRKKVNSNNSIHCD